MSEMIGASPAIERVRAQVARLLLQLATARRPPPVLLEWESDTGKGLIARLLQQGGRRAAGPFVGVNWAAIPGTLLEAELFGYERGAFTDARQARAGCSRPRTRASCSWMRSAPCPMRCRASSSRCWRGGTIRRLGSIRGTAVDAWIIAASNEDLAAAVRAGHLRTGLDHRLAGVPLYLPPLRERGEDLGLLAERFLRQACVDYGRASMLWHRLLGEAP